MSGPLLGSSLLGAPAAPPIPRLVGVVAPLVAPLPPLVVWLESPEPPLVLTSAEAVWLDVRLAEVVSVIAPAEAPSVEAVPTAPNLRIGADC
ncbi:MAG TPA: hypothetical protein VFU02_00735 [Polyangiaceae bacterium]|nr:hypothetical protein [Polyangiaceae bacterium]